ncbi:MAG: stage II sporulation protein M [Spongiibacteraceae bacterium]
MKQQEFEQRYESQWQTLEEWLQLPSPERAAKTNSIALEFPTRYRALCHQLAIAKQRRYSTHLVERLNRIALLAHHRFYSDYGRERGRWLRFFVIDFPQALRANALLIALSAALFILPAIAIGLGCYWHRDLIYSVLSIEQVQHFDEMYRPGLQRIGRNRQTDTDLLMFGYYIKNNIGVAFRTFASGMLLGVGSIFFMIYNGVMMGAVTGYISSHGYTNTFFPFVIGHGAFELTAIVFSGAAGLKLGLAVLAPGQFSRLTALRMAGREAMVLMYGVIAMLTIAAFLEGFWSSQANLPNSIKYSAGIALWCAVILYAVGMGRNRAA